MARGTLAFKQTDVTRALKAAKAAGLEIGRVEIARDGRIVIIPGSPDKGRQGDEERNPWDVVLQ